jgi:long-chain acyl-CoA synthetase
MTSNGCPWHGRYDPGVDPEVEIPDLPLPDRFAQIASEYSLLPALHFFGVTLTYQELKDRSDRFAGALAGYGCGPGDVVGINLPNIPQFLIAQMGALKAGCATSGMSPLLTSRELAYQLHDCRAKALVTLDAIFEHRFAEVSGELPDLKLVVFTGVADFLPRIKRVLGKLLKKVPHGKTRPLPNKTIIDFADFLGGAPPDPPEVKIRMEDHCLIQYTGGTTGTPKGTILTHRNIAANLTQIENWIKPNFGNELFLSGFPLFHLAGLALGLASLFMGGTQILIPNPRETKHIVKEMAKYKPTILVNVPSLYMMLLEEPGFRKLDFSRLSFCISGASPFPVDCIRELEEVIGEGKLVEVYGMTETSPIVTMNPRRGRKKIGSVGLPVPSTQVRIVDLETGDRELLVGQEGEVIISGPQVMKGYLNRPQETEMALREHDGALWLYTGDVGRMDEDGFLTIVDRTKDMLNVGGFKVFSKEVEEKLYEHPAVELCAIIGVSNPKRPGSDLVKLIVQPSSAYKGVDEEKIKSDLLEFAKTNFAPYKVPKFLELVETMPLTVVGKVDKKALRSDRRA